MGFDGTYGTIETHTVRYTKILFAIATLTGVLSTIGFSSTIINNTHSCVENELKIKQNLRSLVNFSFPSLVYYVYIVTSQDYSCHWHGKGFLTNGL